MLLVVGLLNGKGGQAEDQGLQVYSGLLPEVVVTHRPACGSNSNSQYGEHG